MQNCVCREMNAVPHSEDLPGLLLLVSSVWLPRRNGWESQAGHGILEGKGLSQRNQVHRP